jgi:hypothetical protein
VLFENIVYMIIGFNLWVEGKSGEVFKVKFSPRAMRSEVSNSVGTSLAPFFNMACESHAHLWGL